jgi:hypothetical protein
MEGRWREDGGKKEGGEGGEEGGGGWRMNRWGPGEGGWRSLTPGILRAQEEPGYNSDKGHEKNNSEESSKNRPD